MKKMGFSFSGLDVITFGSFTVYKKPVKMFTFSTAVKNIKHSKLSTHSVDRIKEVSYLKNFIQYFNFNF